MPRMHTEAERPPAGKAPGLYAISLDAKGERSFTYWREASAARTLFEPAEVVTFIEML